MSDPNTGQMDPEEVLRVKLEGLKREHRALDEEIADMEDRWGSVLLEVKRLKKKHVFVMHLMRNVAKRSSGMGLKIMKFHAILHLISDVLLCGVPTEFDTGSNESHHKESKYATKLTQRSEETFNYQTATRLGEFLCIDLAMEEATHDCCVWEHFESVD